MDHRSGQIHIHLSLVVITYISCHAHHVALSLFSAIQTAIRLHVEGKTSLHKDLKLKRREQREHREKRRQAKEEELQTLRALQEERERKLAELELLKEAQKQTQVLLEQDEQRRRQQHEQLQRALEIQLREAEEVSVEAGKKKKRNKSLHAEAVNNDPFLCLLCF